MDIRLLFGLACAMSLLAPASSSRSGPTRILDSSGYKLYQRDRALGSESFSFEEQGDSLRIFSHVIQTLPGPDGEISIDKQIVAIVGSLDYDLKFYQSTLRTGGRDLTRGLVMNDTAFTAYRESSGHGEGDRLVRPPGRLFVIEAGPQVYVLYDVLCRNLHGKTFDRRTLPVIVLGDRDSLMEITAADLGTETIRWGGRPVVARKLRFSDQQSAVFAWVSPRGYMLRLENPTIGLRVVREAPAIRRAPKRPRPPGG